MKTFLMFIALTTSAFCMEDKESFEKNNQHLYVKDTPEDKPVSELYSVMQRMSLLEDKVSVLSRENYDIKKTLKTIYNRLFVQDGTPCEQMVRFHVDNMIALEILEDISAERFSSMFRPNSLYPDEKIESWRVRAQEFYIAIDKKKKELLENLDKK